MNLRNAPNSPDSLSDNYVPGGIAAKVVVNGRYFVPFMSPIEIAHGVEVVAAGLRSRYAESAPLLVCVLKGATLFFADLLRALEFPVTIDFVQVSSYGGGMASSGTLTFTAEPGTEIAGRNVIVVEDIVDTGRTVAALREYFLERQAASVEVAALLYKPEAHCAGAKPEYVAFEIANRFVVGYGLDYAEQGRNLSGIYVLEDDSHGESAEDGKAERE